MNKLIEDLKKDLKDSRNYILFLIPLIVVSIIFCIIIKIGISEFDNYILGQISKVVNYRLTVIMGIITSMCTPTTMLYIVLLCLLLFKNKRIGIGITFALLFSGGTNLILKAIFSRQRPIQYMLIDESGYSFPSGHSMVSIAFYGFLIYVFYNVIENKKVRNIVLSLLVLLIIAIAFSRLYFGVHYPTDVLAGLTLGYISLYIYIKIFSKYIIKNEKT